MIFTPVNGTCSSNIDDWRSLETLYCTTGGKYHCLPNEKRQYGRICTNPMWIQSNLCPEYNTKANKIDAKLCNFRYGDCPTKNYLSNQAYAYSACFSTKEEIRTSSEPVLHTLEPNTTDDVKFPVAEVLVPICIVALFVIVIGIIVYRRKQRNKAESNGEKEQMIPPEPCKEIEKHKNDTAFYPRTHAIETGWSKLFNVGALIVVGLPGAGKTNLGLELGSRFNDFKVLKGKCTCCKLLHRLESLEEEINTKYCTYLLLDDCLEKWNFQQEQSSMKKDLYNLDLIYEIHTKRSKELFIVLTVNTHTWQRFSETVKGYKMFSPENILEFSYTVDDKREILQYHIKASEMHSDENTKGSLEHSDTVDCETLGIGKNESENTKQEQVSVKDDDKGNFEGTQEEINFDDTYYDYIVNGKDNASDIDEKTVDEILHANISTIGFPESCYLFCRDRAYMKKGSKFFEKPVDCLIGRFLGWFTSSDNLEKAHFCSLSYALLHGGKIDVDCIDSDLLTEVRKFCSLEIHDQDLIRKSVQYLAGVYLTENTKNNFVFQHDTVTFAVLRLLCHKNSGLVLKICEPRILTKFVRQESYKDKRLPSEMVYCISTNHAGLLAKRLAESTTSTVDTSIYMLDKHFVQLWRKVQKDGDTEPENYF